MLRGLPPRLEKGNRTAHTTDSVRRTSSGTNTGFALPASVRMEATRSPSASRETTL